VTNHGPDDATNPGVGFAFDRALPDLQFTSLPSGWNCGTPQVSGETTNVACNASSLAANASAAFTLQATAPAVGWSPEFLNMAAATTSETDDPDTANNDAQASVLVTSQADLSIGFIRTGVTTGSVANFRVPVGNAGPTAADNVHVTITGNVPRTALTLAQPSGWTCQRIPETTVHIECARNAAMPSGSNEMIAFSAMVSRSAALQFDASIYSDNEDPDPDNNTARYSKP
jgi:hypothetical protein